MNGAMQVEESNTISLHDFVNMLITFPIEEFLLSVSYIFERIFSVFAV
jgi:hypothetical protein